MCTRFFIATSNKMLQEIFEKVRNSSLTQRYISEGKSVKTEGEIRPTDVVPVLAPNPNGERKVYPMKWGYTNHYGAGGLLLNARTETASVKPTFKEDWLRHRCIIPASYYYEWEHIKQSDGKTETGDRYMLRPKDCSETWLCGLYHFENDLPTFVVLTREPGESIRFIHDRMPLILPEALIPEWIKPESDPLKIVVEALTDIIAEKG